MQDLTTAVQHAADRISPSNTGWQMLEGLGFVASLSSLPLGLLVNHPLLKGWACEGPRS